MIGFQWLYKDQLAGSAQPGLYGDWDEDILFLKERAITSVISLTEKPLIEKQLKQEDFDFMHFPIRDMDVPMLRNAHGAILRLAHQIEEGKKCLLHCKGGVGRTGMIAACYLTFIGWSAPDAISEVRAKNHGYIQTKHQEFFVYNFSDFILEQKAQ